MSDLKITEGLARRIEATQDFAALEHVALKSLSTDDIGAMYVECQILREHVFTLVRAVAALELQIRTGQEPQDPFEIDINSLLNGGH